MRPRREQACHDRPRCLRGLRSPASARGGAGATVPERAHTHPGDSHIEDCEGQDGHCFRDGILNLCKNVSKNEFSHFQLESGSFETLIKLADEGLGITLLPYLHTLDIKDKDKVKLKNFVAPVPAREVSLIFPKTELKYQIIDALRTTISGVVRGAIAFQNVQIISPLQKK